MLQNYFWSAQEKPRPKKKKRRERRAEKFAFLKAQKLLEIGREEELSKFLSEKSGISITVAAFPSDPNFVYIIFDPQKR